MPNLKQMTHKFRLDDGIIQIPPWDYAAMRVAAQKIKLIKEQRNLIRPTGELLWRKV